MLRGILQAAAMLLCCASSLSLAGPWEDYKARFVQDDGAVIDTGNNGMSHSEGQSYGLLFSEEFGDRATFDTILKWTYDNLYDQDSGLFVWAYKRHEQNPTADRNNASDGDLMIANALLRAAERWDEREYARKAESICMNLLGLTITDYAGFKVMLPGVKGFYYADHVIVNPSYYIYPALDQIYKKTFLKPYLQLTQDSRRMMALYEEQSVKLAPDWVKLLPTGKTLPAEEWPCRSSYDAIRVPLYLYWSDPAAPELRSWKEYFGRFDKGATPAYVNVSTGETADYLMSSGLRAVRDLVMGDEVLAPEISKAEDYYNASLSMLAYLAYRDTHKQDETTYN